jgi:hypothetical protein
MTSSIEMCVERGGREKNTSTYRGYTGITKEVEN